MISMQYKITLPSDYDMNIIKERTLKNGSKTDGFDGLNFKCYLITEKDKHGNIQNSYAPLYLWDDVTGMNKFIFEGFYDNILQSFGWQTIETNVPFSVNVKDDMIDMKYAIETVYNIDPSETVANFSEIVQQMFEMSPENNYLVMYNPTNWTLSHYFFTDQLNEYEDNDTVYKILHVSR